MKIIRILVYEGDATFMHVALARRAVKQSKTLDHGTITEAWLSDPILLGLGFDNPTPVVQYVDSNGKEA